MKNTIILLFFIALLGLAQRSSGETSTPGEIDHLISDYFLYVSQDDFISASELFHYPPLYSPEQRRMDIEGVAKLLEAFTGSFGRIHSPTLNTVEQDIFGLQIGGGDLPYWQKHPEYRSLVYQVDFSNYGNGFITFTICNLKDKYEIREVRYGLSASPDSSALLFKEAVHFIHLEVEE